MRFRVHSLGAKKLARKKKDVGRMQIYSSRRPAKTLANRVAGLVACPSCKNLKSNTKLIPPMCQGEVALGFDGRWAQHVALGNGQRALAHRTPAASPRALHEPRPLAMAESKSNHFRRNGPESSHRRALAVGSSSAPQVVQMWCKKLGRFSTFHPCRLDSRLPRPSFPLP